MEGQKKILVLCGGRFALDSLKILAFENFLCGVGIGKGSPPVTAALEKESASGGFAFSSFPDKKSMEKMTDWIDSIQPDYIFSISFPYLLPEDVLAYGEDKFINFHPGPLPGYRGPMPIFEVLRYGEPETAVSVHYMNSEFDEGDLLLVEPVKIEAGETYGTLSVKMSRRTSHTVQNVANMLQYATKIPRFPQNNAVARYFEKPEAMDTIINWDRMNTNEILDLIRACNPWNEGADAIIAGENVKMISASLSDHSHTSVPGSVLGISENQGLTLACLENKAIEVTIIRSDHGIMTAFDFGKIIKVTNSILPLEKTVL